jgi:hypothetical protein
VPALPAVVWVVAGVLGVLWLLDATLTAAAGTRLRFG